MSWLRGSLADGGTGISGDLEITPGSPPRSRHEQGGVPGDSAASCTVAYHCWVRGLLHVAEQCWTPLHMPAPAPQQCAWLLNLAHRATAHARCVVVHATACECDCVSEWPRRLSSLFHTLPRNLRPHKTAANAHMCPFRLPGFSSACLSTVAEPTRNECRPTPASNRQVCPRCVLSAL